MQHFFKLFLFFLLFSGKKQNAFAQSGLTKKEQLAFDKREKQLKKQFAQASLNWPAKQLYIRSFKQDGQLEIWVRNAMTEPFTLFKTYNVCALSGKLGPKRKEGDLQVPEGFYYINEFNPNSDYHFSLGINYPNQSDLYFTDSKAPGGDIYIHGKCATVGCIPILNNPIEELYVLANIVRKQGQDFIPVHIFPVRFTNENSFKVLQTHTSQNNLYQAFANQLKEVFDYFEQYKQLPIVGINEKGVYKVIAR
ncbi:murein L,D-transpeptidase family protein [Sediminibacterium sp.]|uniref:L,D-transpeptidase family protein n=1 Tax=Sediminibacterium sp. TaxID=1917865 RepID=UPI00273556F9|nr:L,D-transpeptidase family protein [Sediminibacterium sp.]MDP3394069.1 L,D-transpeptidase family protein [Sediminibacterium sp.]MDP3566342.1 L,D-transpeptidase family protein [Sediminibacterium sp.]